MQNAFDKLEAAADQLGFPHSSNVEGAERLRGLRPRSGRSPWRAFYRRIGDTMVIGAIGPEANNDQRRFRAAVQAAMDRLAQVEREAGR